MNINSQDQISTPAFNHQNLAASQEEVLSEGQATGEVEKLMSLFKENDRELQVFCGRLEDLVGRLVGPQTVGTAQDTEPAKVIGIVARLYESFEAGVANLGRLDRAVSQLEKLI